MTKKQIEGLKKVFELVKLANHVQSEVVKIVYNKDVKISELDLMADLILTELNKDKPSKDMIIKIVDETGKKLGIE